MSVPVLNDRRRYPRLECDVPVRISDYHFEWDARAHSLCNGGVFIGTRQVFVEGQDVEITVLDVEFEQEVALEGQVRWVRSQGLGPHGIGVAFLERRAERLEILHDLVDRLAVEDVEIAARFRSASKPLPMSTVLYVARNAPRSPVLTNEERAFLACVDGSTTLEEIQTRVGIEAFVDMAYAPFSLLSKGVLTTSARHGVKSPPQALGPARARQVMPAFASGAYSRKQVEERNVQAQRYFQEAREALQAGDKRKAHTLLALALQLAPGDPEIGAALRALEG